jgi:hypothetical protein
MTTPYRSIKKVAGLPGGFGLACKIAPEEELARRKRTDTLCRKI